MKTAGVGFVIQARYNSSRLPGKVFIPFYGQQTMLDIIIERLYANYQQYPIILATTTNTADDAFEKKYSNDIRVRLFRGDEQNVLERFILAAGAYHLEHIIRICSDNPFLLSNPFSEMIQHYFKVQADYLSYRFKNELPVIKSHIGLYGEIASVSALKKITKLTDDAIYYEHVTNYLYTHPADFKPAFLPVPQILDKYYNKLRLTVDTTEDLNHLKKLYKDVLDKYGENYKIENILTAVNNDINLQNSMQTQINENAK